MDDRLQRFRDAQQASYDQALAELRAGTKRSHWIWFVFPQIAGLGRSAMAQRYALVDVDEAREYLADAVLGARLRECAAALLSHADRSAEQILGGIDAVKVRSSMTLFHRADPSEPVFGQVLDRFYDGVPDPATDDRL